MANFFLLADYLSVKLTYEKVIKKTKIMIKDCKNVTLIQHLLETFLNLFFVIQIITQIVKFLQNNIALQNKQL